MSKKDVSLGDRMKLYELHHTNQVLLQGVPVLARMDGRSFHNYTKHMDRPYDASFSEAMVQTAMRLVEETNALVAYTQSDEISLLWLDNVYFDGKVHKMLSHLGSQTTIEFYKHHGFRHTRSKPTFDARVWVVPSKSEAANYFLWREQDAIKNSISMAASCYYSPSELYQKNSDERQEMLFQKGINWNNYAPHFKRGTFVRREAINRRMTSEELQDLPPLHHARANPNMVVHRSEVREVVFDGIIATFNREEFLFDGAAPITHTKEELNARYKKITPWDTCKIDDPVYVQITDHGRFYRRHFAGINSIGDPMFWDSGRTSFSNISANPVSALYCYPADQAPEDVVKCAVI